MIVPIDSVLGHVKTTSLDPLTTTLGASHGWESARELVEAAANTRCSSVYAGSVAVDEFCPDCNMRTSRVSCGSRASLRLPAESLA